MSFYLFLQVLLSLPLLLLPPNNLSGLVKHLALPGSSVGKFNQIFNFPFLPFGSVGGEILQFLRTFQGVIRINIVILPVRIIAILPLLSLLQLMKGIFNLLLPLILNLVVLFFLILHLILNLVIVVVVLINHLIF